VTLLHLKLRSPFKKVGSKAKGRRAGGGSNAVAPAETLFVKSFGIKTQHEADLNFHFHSRVLQHIKQCLKCNMSLTISVGDEEKMYILNSFRLSSSSGHPPGKQSWTLILLHSLL